MAAKREPAWVAKGDRIAIGIVTIGALLAAAAIIAVFVVTLVGQLTTGEMTVTLLPYSPVPDGFFDGIALESADFTEATVVTSGLSSGVAGTLIAANAVGALTSLIVAIALAFMGWRLLKGDPFRRSVLWTSLTAAIALVIGPFIGLLLTTIGQTLALMEIAGPAAGEGGLPFRGELELTPVLVGLGLAVVLGVFEFGQKLKADTDGLV